MKQLTSRKLLSFLSLLLALICGMLVPIPGFSQDGQLNQCKMANVGGRWAIENDSGHRLKVTYSANERKGDYSSEKSQEVRAGSTYELAFDVTRYKVSISKVEIAD